MQVNLEMLSAAAATGATIKLSVSGRFAFAVAGIFDTCTVSLDILGPDGATWIAVGSSTTLTAAGMAIVELPSGIYRASVTSAGGTTSVSATLKSADQR